MDNRLICLGASPNQLQKEVCPVGDDSPCPKGPERHLRVGIPGSSPLAHLGWPLGMRFWGAGDCVRIRLIPKKKRIVQAKMLTIFRTPLTFQGVRRNLTNVGVSVRQRDGHQCRDNWPIMVYKLLPILFPTMN